MRFPEESQSPPATNVTAIPPQTSFYSPFPQFLVHSLSSGLIFLPPFQRRTGPVVSGSGLGASSCLSISCLAPGRFLTELGRVIPHERRVRGRFVISADYRGTAVVLLHRSHVDLITCLNNLLASFLSQCRQSKDLKTNIFICKDIGKLNVYSMCSLTWNG